MTAIDSNPIQLFPHFSNNAIDKYNDIMTYNDKMVRLQGLQVRYTYKDTEEEALVKDALQICQKSWYKELGLNFFEFTLHYS